MNLGIDLSSLLPPRTGIGNYTFNLVDQLMQLDGIDDLEVHGFVNSLKRSLKDEQFLNHPAFHFHRKKIPGPMLLWSWQKFEKPSIESLIGEVDVFHSPATYIPPQKNGARVTTIHDLWFLQHPEHCDKLGGQYIAKRLEKVIEQMDAIISVSHFTAQEIFEYYNVPEEKIHVVHSGVNSRFKPTDPTPELHSLKDVHGRSLPNEFILSVSTIESRKNFIGLLNAYLILKEKYTDFPPLVLTGNLTLTEESFESLPKVKDFVFFTGYVDDEVLPALYSAAKLFVMPSFCEGFGLPVLESMACGTCVACSMGSALDETGGDVAFRFDAENVEEIAAVLYDAITSDEKRGKMIQKAFEHVKKFCWERCARETLQVYRSVKK